MPVATPQPVPTTPETVITDEAGPRPGAALDFRVEPLVAKGDFVAQGAPIVRDRRRPDLVLTAPMAGRIAALDIGAGRRLGDLVIYREDRDDRHQYDPRKAQTDTGALRALLQASGLWMNLRARPFGGVPPPDAQPAAIFIMAVDTRPLAPDPRLALEGPQSQALTLGLRALRRICEGPIHLCQDRGPDIVPPDDGLTVHRVAPLHPAGLAGFQIHRLFPARADRPVWTIAAEDVAAIGQLLDTGHLPATRLVSVAGPGLRETRLVRCQPGADLRALSLAQMTPGQRVILSGSALEGREARWLGFHDRQVTVIARPTAQRGRNWLEAALRGASRAEPVLATAALDQALGGLVPGMALLRALAVGDDETAEGLGALSLLEDDLTLADYVAAANPRFSTLLRAALDRIEANA